MRIYSDVLSGQALVNACQGIGIYVEWDVIRAPRLRVAGYNVATSGNTNRWKSSGTFGRGSERSATWDQHGQWMARLFAIDPRALIVACGRYDGAEDFHTQTKGKYR